MKSNFNIYKISLGKGHFAPTNYQTMLDMNLISVHPDTNSKGKLKDTQYEHFINAKKGDLFYICRSNDSIDVIGMFKDERPLKSFIETQYEHGWVDREFITLFKAKSSNAYDKDDNRWWMPRDNSTFIQISSPEWDEFDKAILSPVFNINLSDLEYKRNEELEKNKYTIYDIAKLQHDMGDFLNNKKDILDVLNQQTRIERLKNLYELEQQVTKGRPVVTLRKRVAEYLVEDDTPLTDSNIQKLKKEIAEKHERNVFHSWKSNVRILYPLFYNQHKVEIVTFMISLINKLREDLNIKEFTKFNLVHLDGAQNQGFDEIWFAIYNHTHKKHRTAKQLYFSIKNEFRYGLLEFTNQNLDQIIKTDNFNYDEILEHFRSLIPEIVNDDISKYEYMQDLRDILEYKKQIILQGSPGTGKTYTAKNLAEYIITNEVNFDKKVQAAFINESEQIEIIQFHPAYTYEDFIRGIVTEPLNGQINYTVKDKLFLELVNKAANDKDKKPYVLIIDEINRANLASVLGELIYALEYRVESFKSMYAVNDNYQISIPDNMYIIGTMNTADRSVGHIDYAIRRRFAFYDMLPTVIYNDNFEVELFEKVSKLFVKEIKSNVSELEASEHLSMEFQDRPQDIWLGHSYFIRIPDFDFQLRIQYEIIPILQEYINDGILENTDEVRKIINEIASYNSNNANSEN